MKQVPTTVEQGFPTILMQHWGGIFAPKGTPVTILDRIATVLPTSEVILQIMNPAFGKAEGESAHRRNQDAYQQIYRDAAKRRGLLLVDHSLAWNHLLATAGEPAVKKLIPDGVHPNVEGWRRIVTPTLHRALDLDLAPPP
eukprot:gene20255-biopygen17803